MVMDGGQLAALLAAQNGWYDRPQGGDGKFKGPLVGYAGTYPTLNGGWDHYVGNTYINCAVLEEHPRLLADVVLHGLFPRFTESPIIGDSGQLVFCGAPEGGKSIALLLAYCHDTQDRFVFPEKKVTKLANAGSREKTELVWGRHQVNPGDNVIITEDILNNFSTTGELVRLIESAGGHVIGIAALVNRSTTVDDWYHPDEGDTPIPVVAILRKPIPQYKQDDPEVRDDVRAGNVVWKPKDEWPSLAEAMSMVA